jgi:hypothetical protein
LSALCSVILSSASQASHRPTWVRGKDDPVGTHADRQPSDEENLHPTRRDPTLQSEATANNRSCCCLHLHAEINAARAVDPYPLCADFGKEAALSPLPCLGEGLREAGIAADDLLLGAALLLALAHNPAPPVHHGCKHFLDVIRYYQTQDGVPGTERQEGEDPENSSYSHGESLSQSWWGMSVPHACTTRFPVVEMNHAHKLVHRACILEPILRAQSSFHESRFPEHVPGLLVSRLLDVVLRQRVLRTTMLNVNFGPRIEGKIG